MSKVLILVVSSQLPPYGKMIETSLATWDSTEVDNCETIFYCGGPIKPNTEKIIYFDIPESYSTMGRKMLGAFEWVLANKEFDFIARVNASTFVNKRELVNHIQKLPEGDFFSGLIVKAGKDYNHSWIWGFSFILSKSVVQKIVANKQYWNHSIMDDVSLSELATKLSIPLTDGTGCSIDKLEGGWRCLCYGTESYEFSDFSGIKKDNGQFFFRCKYDSDRNVDEWIMKELFKNLNS